LQTARRRVRAGPATSAYLCAWTTDALCAVAVDAGAAEAPHWVATLEALAARTGMRRLLARAAAYREALGPAARAAAA